MIPQHRVIDVLARSLLLDRLHGKRGEVHVVGKFCRHLDIVNERMFIGQQTVSKNESLAFDGNILIILADGKLFRYPTLEV
jgi:hypothetical protein